MWDKVKEIIRESLNVANYRGKFSHKEWAMNLDELAQETTTSIQNIVNNKYKLDDIEVDEETYYDEVNEALLENDK